jgi:hypothetical protein
MKLLLAALAACCVCLFSRHVNAQTGNASDYQGPVGVTGMFTAVTTAGSYDPLTHSARREVDDLVVPGAVGKYPLKMTRYLNTRGDYAEPDGMGPGWTHQYLWFANTNGAVAPHVFEPNGVSYDYRCGNPVAVSEGWENWSYDPVNHTFAGTFRLADGGKVSFVNSVAVSIADPYGVATSISYTKINTFNMISTVTEAGGRYLKFIYGDYDSYHFKAPLLTRVEAYDGPANHLIDWVNYSYSVQPASGSESPFKVLTLVGYSDGTSASYGYRDDNATESLPLCSKSYPLVAKCSDVRFKGPMRQIAYQYEQFNTGDGGYSSPHGAIKSEQDYSGTINISSISPKLPTTTETNTHPTTGFTETRADGATRKFNYSTVLYGRPNPNDGPPGPCPLATPSPDGPDNQQVLKSYTDFQGNPTTLGYDGNWFVNAVTDGNGKTTNYVRGASIGEIQQITYPWETSGPNTWVRRSVSYTYWPEPSPAVSGHYIYTFKDERGNITTYHRDGNNRVYQIDYPADIHGTVAHAR